MLNNTWKPLGVVLIAAGAVLAYPADGQASTCSYDMVTEAGTCAQPVPVVPLTADQQAQLAQKDSLRVAIDDALNAADTSSSGQATPFILPPGGGGGSTTENFKLSSVVNMTIFKEGQGNGKKSYTCGPSASRNVIYAMTSHDYGEAQFATWEGTTTSGTARANIASALNAHFTSAWATTRPDDKTTYLSYVISDTKYVAQPVIANVDTEYLSFFGGHALDHFDFVYGFDNTGSTKYLYIGEEWDPIYTYGTSSYGNPFGKHKEQLSNAFTAVDHTPIHGIVW